MKLFSFFLSLILLVACKVEDVSYSGGTRSHTNSHSSKRQVEPINFSRANDLDYAGIPDNTTDRSILTFSDEGAWFSFGFSDSDSLQGGFTGPYLMTQENGVWASEMLAQLNINDLVANEGFTMDAFEVKQWSSPSHLAQMYSNNSIEIHQQLFFMSSTEIRIETTIENFSGESLTLRPIWSGTLMNESLSIEKNKVGFEINSTKSDAKGYLGARSHLTTDTIVGNSYSSALNEIILLAGKSVQFQFSQAFVFPNQVDEQIQFRFKPISTGSITDLQRKTDQKYDELIKLYKELDDDFTNGLFFNLTTKAYLTLQNNWRVPAGELKHAGLFPSYNYKWFHGFWAWDSWKYAVALSKFNPELAQDQIRAMYDYQEDDGFIPDCIFRDTTVEKHNYRNTKAPLSAWAVWYSQKGSVDRDFLAEMYPQLVKQHNWWYENRDHDGDGMCEYGSTDGTLIAAKWESGMDNAVRFDESEILKNKEGAYSLNQESVDLNAYLAAEKYYLSLIATNIFSDDGEKYKAEFEALKIKIQAQFFDTKTGWFYDTNLDGTEFIKVMGCEGWIPLWANVATQEQAEAVKNNMMDTSKFNTKVPFQTLSADHPKFKPDGGYWRGPNWLDQSYFGLVGLHHYSFVEEYKSSATKLLLGCEGLMQKGGSIRENYNPITGEGLEAHNFSWSAAHVLMLITGLEL